VQSRLQLSCFALKSHVPTRAALHSGFLAPMAVSLPYRRRLAGHSVWFITITMSYRNGIDFHLDWGASHFLSNQLFVGLAGCAYQQITDDSGQNPILGGFRSRVLGVGPQIGYLFPVGGVQGFLGLRAYGEFDATNRASGWNTWLTFSISPAAPAAEPQPTKRLATK
jgi:hypothetical protein